MHILCSNNSIIYNSTDSNGNIDPEAPPSNYGRRRSRAVLYQLSGHYKQDNKHKIKLNNVRLYIFFKIISFLALTKTIQIATNDKHIFLLILFVICCKLIINSLANDIDIIYKLINKDGYQQKKLVFFK